MHRRLLVTLVGVICLGLSACVAPAQEEIVAHGSKLLPDTTTQDLVTYGDHFVELTAVSESRIPPPQEERDRGEGLIERVVQTKIASTKWTRPTLSSRVPQLSTTLDIDNGGWVFRGGVETPLRIEGQPKLTIGESYTAMITYVELTPGEYQWMVLSIAPVSQGVIDTPTTNQVGQQLDGLTIDRAAAVLANTKPDPAAAEHMDDDPVVRWQAAAPK